MEPLESRRFSLLASSVA
ncbi:hypothetical protein DNTS_025495 [Danionella cerebrum]|uniref:Uncharacterized protein n=1 Tax=Danionella cerebrum TaxID=2873325 RepID=A0A553R992_9TELE|nr:hypothetical protein DNTS_025495 [Danionella translucida]